MKLLVIADDFTGALDTGIQFAKQEISTAVVLYPPEGQLDLPAEHAVVAVDTESRHLPPQEAAERVSQVTAAACRLGCRCFFKKTDSTLRGNIGSELEAMLLTMGATRLVFAPAFPQLKRYTRKGVQYVGDLPLGESDFAADPFNPVKHSRVRDILAEQTALPVRECPDSAVPAPGEKPEILVMDSETPEALSAIGGSLKKRGELTCLAGCAGFAGVLPEFLDLPRTEQAAQVQSRRVLFVCGSVHPKSVEQCAWAVKELGYERFSLTAEELLFGSDRAETVAEALRKTGRVLISGEGGREQIPITCALGEKRGLKPALVPGKIAENTGKLAVEVLRRTPADLLVVFGGDTLMGIAQAAGCRLVVPCRELTAGVVLSEMHCDLGTIPVVTKAGGFGDVDLMGLIHGRKRGIDHVL